MALLRLTELNDYLHELMRGHQARVLKQTTERTYLEIVQVRSSVEELTQLVNAALLLERDGSEDSSISAARRRSNMAPASLATFKILNAINDDPRRVKPPRYAAILESGRKRYFHISYSERNVAISQRTDGRFHPDGGAAHQVWIEWKPYKEVWN